MIGFIEIVAWITLVAVCIQGPLGAILEGQYTKGLGENLAIQGSLLNSFDSISSNARCAGRCTNERNYLSYNYNKEQRKCQLNSVSSKWHPRQHQDTNTLIALPMVGTCSYFITALTG